MPDPSSRLDNKEPAPLTPVLPPKPGRFSQMRRLVLGDPISSEHAEHSLLPRFLALPVFASDAISSVAYATQQIILALGAAGLYLASRQDEYTKYTMLITGLIVGLLVIVVLSYWQTIFAYPKGGGSYIVTRENLGRFPSLAAGAALLIDYVLTVSVSVAAGVQNLSGVPLPGWLSWLHFDHLIPWCMLFIALLSFANLRGLKESGALFAIPTYGFVFMCYLMIFLGFVGPTLFHWELHKEFVNQDWGGHAEKAVGGAIFIVLFKAFANGCSAMTGTEAVSDGIPAFKEPKSFNAATTLLMMGVILGTLFLGISALAMRMHVVYWEHDGITAKSVIDQLAGAVYGKTGTWAFGYYITQIATAAILILAANTSYADFPRLASILARDGFLPKQMANIGDKLGFDNGILLLGITSALLIVLKKGNVDALIPLYAVGVFTAFTFSQSSMVKRWVTLRDKGWRIKAAINTVGAITTFIVLMDIIIEKFSEGAWIVLLLMALVVGIFLVINKHYRDVARQLSLKDQSPMKSSMTNTVIVLVPGLHRGVIPALEYAHSLSTDCRAVYIETDHEKTALLTSKWDDWASDVPLVVLNSPYRSLISPIMHYLDAVQLERRNHLITVIVPEFVPTQWWQHLLHGNNGLLLKAALMGRKDIVVANLRYYLQDSNQPTPMDMPEDVAIKK